MAFLTRSSSEHSFGNWLEKDFLDEYDAGFYGAESPVPPPPSPTLEEEVPTFPKLRMSPTRDGPPVIVATGPPELIHCPFVLTGDEGSPYLPPSPTVRPEPDFVRPEPDFVSPFEEQGAHILWAGDVPLQLPALTPVEAVRHRIYTLGPQENLDNPELAVVADNIYAFTQEELMNIPNVYIRGNTHYPLQMAREVMTALKMAATLGGCSLHQILPPFLTEDHCQCYCTVKAASGMMCSRKRRIGETTCSRHVAVTGESVPAYVLKMNASKLARMGEPVV